METYREEPDQVSEHESDHRTGEEEATRDTQRGVQEGIQGVVQEGEWHQDPDGDDRAWKGVSHAGHAAKGGYDPAAVVRIGHERTGEISSFGP